MPSRLALPSLLLVGTLVSCGAPNADAAESASVTDGQESSTSGSVGNSEATGHATSSAEETGDDPPFSPDPSWRRWELRFEAYPVPARETTYACFGASFTVDQPVHVVAFEPVIDDAAVVHHMLLSITQDPIDFVEPCTPAPEGQIALQWGWAPGIEPLVVPEDAGFLVGDGPGEINYALQIHYNNPLEDPAHVDSSGIDIYYTTQLRPDDAGVFALGDVASLSIPPGQPTWETIHWCTGESTQLLMQQPAHVFGSWLHAHQLAKAMWTDHRRDGSKIGELGRQDPYFFDSQRIEPLDAVIDPGDALVTHCIYDSTGRTEHTYGGDASTDEMCLNYLLYHPKQPFLFYCSDP